MGKHTYPLPVTWEDGHLCYFDTAQGGAFYLARIDDDEMRTIRAPHMLDLPRGFPQVHSVNPQKRTISFWPVPDLPYEIQFCERAGSWLM